MNIALKRAYEKPAPSDGYRVLVDRLWPRGVARAEARIDEWIKEAAPSDGLRTSYHDGALGWAEFRSRYLAELRDHRGELRKLADRAAEGKVTLVFSSKNKERNNAVVMKQYLKMLGAR